MLYDTIAESAIVEKSMKFPRGLMAYRLAEVLVDTPKFVLSDTVAKMVNTLAEKRPASLMAGLPICVMPFDRIWVEMPYSAVIETLQEIGVPLHHLDTAENPVNLGYLMEKLPDHQIRVTVAWDHKTTSTRRPAWWRKHVQHELLKMDRHVTVALLASTFNGDPSIQISEEDIQRELDWAKSGLYSDAGWLRPAHRTPRDIEATAAFSKRLTNDVGPYTLDYFNMIVSGTLDYPGGLRQLSEEAAHDIGGEWRRALAILMVFNSKTCVELVEQDRSKLSKARVKKGKPPTPNYRLVNMYLSRVQRNRLLSSGVKMADLRKHMVAAHFKVRKTGVFLWSAHIRGYIGEAKIPERIVKD